MSVLLDTTLPVFGTILAGYILARMKILPRESADYFNRFVYFFSFPALLLGFVSKTPPEKILYWPFVFAWTGGLLVAFALTALVSMLLYRDQLADLAMRCMNTTCASTAFMGIPLAAAAFGKEAALPAILSTTILAIVIVSLTVLLIEIGRSAKSGSTHVVRDIALSLAKNPLMLAVVAGALVAFTLHGLPSPLQRLCDLAGGAAIPCSLVSIGLFIYGQKLNANLGEIGVLSVLKLVVHPLITWLLIVKFFPLDPVWGRATILMAALPPASTCFVIAKRYDAYVAQTSAMAVLTTVVSVFTISVLLLLIGH